jgi:hypothetical protein
MVITAVSGESNSGEGGLMLVDASIAMHKLPSRQLASAVV